MQTEIEVKFLRVDHGQLRAKLKKLGAEPIQPQRLMRRKNYDFPDMRLEQVGGWVRVRDEGDKVTVSYKQLNDRTLHGTKEVNLVVNDFDQADAFLGLIGLAQMSYQETKRESWELHGVQIELDEWPWVPPYFEIEGPTENAVRETANRLGFKLEDGLHGSVEVVYQDIFDVTEEEVNRMKVVTFGPVPEWLEAKRRQHEDH